MQELTLTIGVLSGRPAHFQNNYIFFVHFHSTSSSMYAYKHGHKQQHVTIIRGLQINAVKTTL